MNYKTKGTELRNEFKDLVYTYMQSKEECLPLSMGMK